MVVHGLCPARDEFFLVVCEQCQTLVKPQALDYHIGECHKRIYSVKLTDNLPHALVASVVVVQNAGIRPEKSFGGLYFSRGVQYMSSMMHKCIYSRSYKLHRQSDFL